MSNQINELPLDERIQLFEFLTSACTHMFSKGKFQAEKFDQIKDSFAKIATDDPFLAAHLASYAMSKSQSKDFKVLSVYFNFLNDADGTPFYVGSDLNKPNLRSVSAALLQDMSPHLALRVLELGRHKFSVDGTFELGGHYPSQMKTAFRKYILYREANPNIMKGIKNSGLARKMIRMYKLMHMAPTPETAAILGWNQRGRTIEKEVIDFKGKSSEEVAEFIVKNKLNPVVALGALDNDSINLDIAEALLEVSTGNQSVILHNYFRRNGFLDVPEFNELFMEKVGEVSYAVDRIDTLSQDLTLAEKEQMAKVRSKVRKSQMEELGKVFLHIDVSVSMQGAIELAKERASIIAEAINNPEENFNWGTFGNSLVGNSLRKPKEFTKEHFHQILYGKKANEPGTNCVGCYPLARDFGADVDIYFTDQRHNHGGWGTDSIKRLLENYTKNSNGSSWKKPKAALIFSFGNDSSLKNALERFGIPVEVLNPNMLKESSLIIESVNRAIKGKQQLIDDVMSVELPELPDWWNDPSLERDYKERLNA